MNIFETTPEYGSPINGVTYSERPSAYALILNSNKELAMLKTQRGYYLPGGGIEAGETPVEALEREVIEETGYLLSIHRSLGRANQFIYSRSRAAHWKKIGHFYMATLVKKISTPIETDQELIFMPINNAVEFLTQEFQAASVNKFLNAQMPPSMEIAWPVIYPA